jgi:hypothetical protein
MGEKMKKCWVKVKILKTSEWFKKEIVKMTPFLMAEEKEIVEINLGKPRIKKIDLALLYSDVRSKMLQNVIWSIARNLYQV